MSEHPLYERMALGERLLELKSSVAEQVTKVFLEAHPDWVSKYGERAWRFGVEDAQFHIDFLRGAIEADSVAAFEDYCHWAVRVLQSRGIAKHFLVENLTQIETVLQNKLPPVQHAMISRFAREGRLACNREKAVLAEPDDALALTRSVYLQSILLGNRAGSAQIVEEALREGAGIFDIYTRVFQASLYEVGRLWEEGRITVSVEHRATAVTQFVMAGLYSRFLPAESSTPPRHAVVTGVAGELHQIGANMVADVLENAGWNVDFLGTNAPHSGIIEAVRTQKSDLLCISATMLFNIPSVVQLIRDVRATLPESRILIGGAAFRCSPGAWRTVGADSYAFDLNSAVERANQLLVS